MGVGLFVCDAVLRRGERHPRMVASEFRGHSRHLRPRFERLDGMVARPADADENRLSYGLRDLHISRGRNCRASTDDALDRKRAPTATLYHDPVYNGRRYSFRKLILLWIDKAYP